LGPTANFQGSYKFLSLRTGKRITLKQFKEIPMPDYIIKRLEAMVIHEKQDKTITFSNRSGEPIPDLHASPDTDGIEADAGVSNDGSNDRIENNDNSSNDGDDGNNEGQGIKIEQNENANEIEAPHEDPEYRWTTLVTATERPTGVTMEVTRVITTGVTAEVT
jgi:hypothetical protein